jgi:hypothetical protein
LFFDSKDIGFHYSCITSKQTKLQCTVEVIFIFLHSLFFNFFILCNTHARTIQRRWPLKNVIHKEEILLSFCTRCALILSFYPHSLASFLPLFCPRYSHILPSFFTPTPTPTYREAGIAIGMFNTPFSLYLFFSLISLHLLLFLFLHAHFLVFICFLTFTRFLSHLLAFSHIYSLSLAFTHFLSHLLSLSLTFTLAFSHFLSLSLDISRFLHPIIYISLL